MPKLKTKKALVKRVKVTKNKKILRSRAGRRHLLSHKTARRKRLLGKKALVTHSERRAIKAALPYSF